MLLPRAELCFPDIPSRMGGGEMLSHAKGPAQALHAAQDLLAALTMKATKAQKGISPHD